MKIVSLKDVHPDNLEFIIKKLHRITSWEDISYFDEFTEDGFDNAYCFYILDDRDKIMAYMTIYVLPTYIQLDNIFVMSDHREKGIATKCLKYIVKKFCCEESMDIILQVNTINTPAIICYLKFGFMITGMWNGFYEYWGKKRNKDCLIMRYKFNERK